MKKLLALILTLTLTSCAMLGSREDAMKNSANSMTQFKGEIFHKNDVFGTYKEVAITADLYPKNFAELKEKNLLPTPGITEFPNAQLKNPLLNTALDSMKAVPTPIVTKQLVISDKNGKKLYDLFLVLNPYSINEKNNAVEHEAWVIFTNGAKQYTEKVKDADKGTLEYYYFDEKWPKILQNLI